MNSKTAYETIEDFLIDWDRQHWMQDHGEWASAQWEDERVEYSEAVEELRNALVIPEDLDGSAADAISDACDTLLAACKALEDQIRPDESDYIATERLDPDDYAESATKIDGLGSQWEGWDCTEGWGAYRAGNALVVNWWRCARGNRHDRDLWVCIDSEFFEGGGE